MSPIDLNIDLGELADEPAELFALATTANVACGGHAGDAASMERAVSRALANGARVASHPSYPDREGFGRTSLGMDPPAIAATVEQQCAALSAIARRLGCPLRRMKPHGALYHDAARNATIAAAVIEGALRGLGVATEDIVIVGPPTGSLRAEAATRGVAYAREGFADRGYRADGSLAPRRSPDALITDPAEAARQALSLARSGAIDTLCVHGDTMGAVAVAARVRAALADAGLLGGA